MGDIGKRRRWPWVVACLAALAAGIAGGFVLAVIGMDHIFRVPCPALFRPQGGDYMPATGPGVFGPRPSGPHVVHIPTTGRIARVQGRSTVLLRIGEDGHVSEAHLVRSSGFCPFDVQALKDVLDWRYVPANRMGTPIASWLVVDVIFPLRPTPAASGRGPRAGANI